MEISDDWQDRGTSGANQISTGAGAPLAPPLDPPLHWKKHISMKTGIVVESHQAELNMGSEKMQFQNKIICALCEKLDETEITGALNSKGNISAHQNCLVS